MPYFGFKAKPEIEMNRQKSDIAMPYFGFKAKPRKQTTYSDNHIAMPYFGFKAKLLDLIEKLEPILPCLILDSRQNNEQNVMVG